MTTPRQIAVHCRMNVRSATDVVRTHTWRKVLEVTPEHLTNGGFPTLLQTAAKKDATKEDLSKGNGHGT